MSDMFQCFEETRWETRLKKPGCQHVYCFERVCQCAVVSKKKKKKSYAVCVKIQLLILIN